MKNFNKYLSVLQDAHGSVSSTEINNCAVRVNNIPLFENVIDSDGKLHSDIELALTKSNDPDVKAYIESGALKPRPSTQVSDWSHPAGVRGVSLAQWFDLMNMEIPTEPTPEPTPSA